MNEIPFNYGSMVELAYKLLECDPLPEQVIVVKTANEEVLFFGNNIQDHACEDSFVEKVSADSIISQIVCMWRDGTLDVTSKYFQDLICTKCVVDDNTTILLRSPDKEYMVCKYVRQGK